MTFEILSPQNRSLAANEKFNFYERYGVEEYYMYDPDQVILLGWLRSGTHLQPIADLEGWVSPRLGIRFDMSSRKLRIFGPNGFEFLTPLESFLECKRQAQSQEFEASAEELEDEAEESVHQLAERFATKLRELGIDPDTLK